MALRSLIDFSHRLEERWASGLSTQQDPLLKQRKLSNSSFTKGCGCFCSCSGFPMQTVSKFSQHFAMLSEQLSEVLLGKL